VEVLNEVSFLECKWVACLPAKRVSGFFERIKCGYNLFAGDKNAAGTSRF
jgi:hypothetical protein